MSPFSVFRLIGGFDGLHDDDGKETLADFFSQLVVTTVWRRSIVV